MQAKYLTPEILKGAVRDSLLKLNPRTQLRNPVMFIVLIGSVLTTVIGIGSLFGSFANEGRTGFILSISAWLWFTVLFANFAEAVAEGRGKAQAATLRAMRRDVMAKRLKSDGRAHFDLVEASQLKRGDLVVVEASDFIPADGEVIEGVATVNESAVTGESAPVLREAGGDFSSVTGGTRVLPTGSWCASRASRAKVSSIA